MAVEFANLMIRPLPCEVPPAVEQAELHHTVIQEESITVSRRRFIHVKRMACAGRTLSPVTSTVETLMNIRPFYLTAEEASLDLPPRSP